MIIREVELKNILSHESTRVEFTPGINVIVGLNGSGKSSIIDSILLSMLGGCTSSREVVRSDLGEVLRVGAQSGYIRVKFEIGGSTYVVERVISRDLGRTTSALKLEKLDGSTRKTLASGREQFCMWIQSLLGISDPLVLTSTLVARQGYLAEFIEMEPSRRKERVLDLVGLSRLEEARDALADEVKRVTAEVAVLESKQRDYREKEKRVKSLEQEVARIEKSLEDARGLRSRIQSELEKVKGELGRLEEALTIIAKLKPLEELRKQIEGEESRVRELESRLSRLGDVDVKGVERLLEMWGSVRTLNSRRRSDSERLRSLESTIARVVEDLRRLGLNPEGDIVEFISRALHGVGEEESRHRELLGSLDGELRTLNNIVNVSVESDRCPLCGSQIGRDRLEHILMEHRGRLEELKRRRAEVSVKLNQLSKRKAVLEDLRRRAEIAYTELPQVRERVLEAEGEIRRFLEMCSSITRTSVREVDECPVEDLRRLVNEVKSMSVALAESRRRLEELKARFNEGEYKLYKSSLEKLGVRVEDVESRYQEARRLREKLELELSKANESVHRLEGELKARVEELSRLRGEVEGLRGELSRLQVKKSTLAALELLRDRVLGKNGVLARVLTSTLREALEANVNGILETLGREFRVRVTEGFDIEVSSGGATLSTRSLSGGERTLLSIAFRLALASILVKKQLSILVLDEPTEYLDENSRRQVFDVIARVAGSVDQVIVVTHDIEVEEIADRILRVNKVGDRSVVEVEEMARAPTAQASS
jgi:exonuclease SbcC